MTGGPGKHSQRTMLRIQIRRRRCSECRRWFRPSAQNAHNQKTCGREECRRRRRARLEKRRRERSLQDSRISERERQRESRRQRRQTGPPPPAKHSSDMALPEGGSGDEGAMSLAGLVSEVTEIMQEILKNWDTMSQSVAPVSLAGLKLQLLEILDESGHFVGQKGQKSPDVTGRPDFVTAGKREERDCQFGTGCHWPAVTAVVGAGT